MDAMTASAILAEQLTARGLSVRNQDDDTLSVTNPLHPLIGETVATHGGRYITDYGYEIGEHGDEPATADRVAYLLGLPRNTGSAKLAADGFNGLIPLNWVRDTGARVTAALAAWGRGDLAELPVGKAWDVVRVQRALGWRTVARMRADDVAVGPVQHTPDGVDVLVPVGSAAAWDLPDTRVLTEGATVAVPHPSIVAPHTLRAHSWIVSPQDCEPLTDADMLHEAYAAALAALHMDAAR